MLLLFAPHAFQIFMDKAFPPAAAALQDLTDTCRQMAGWPEPEGVKNDLIARVLGA